MRRCVMVMCLVALGFVAPQAAWAAPITITQTFDNPFSVLMIVNGVGQEVTGDFVFTILTDTNNPDLRPASTTSGLFATDSITVSNTGLGLVDVPLTSHLFYYESGPSSGITGGLFQSNTALSSTGGIYGATDLGDPNVIEPGFLNFTMTPGEGVAAIIAFSTDPLVFADGTIISFGARFPSGSQTSTLSPVPEPASIFLLAIGALAAGVRRWRGGNPRRPGTPA